MENTTAQPVINPKVSAPSRNPIMTRSRASAGLIRVMNYYERAGAGAPTAD